MSEFTDFHALLTDAENLNALSGSLVRAVGGAHAPLDELPDGDSLMEMATTKAAWADIAKPAWIKMGILGTLDQLATLGPAVRIKVEEDFASWSFDARCGGTSHSFALIASPDRYRGATEGIPLYDPATDTSQIATCLGVSAAALRSTFILDGGESFATLVGIAYEQMLDITPDDIKDGEVSFGYLALTVDD